MRLKGLLSGVVVSLALAAGEGNSAEPLGNPIRQANGPGYGAPIPGQSWAPYPGQSWAPYPVPPYPCQQPGVPQNYPAAPGYPPARPATPPPAAPQQPKADELSMPRPVDPSRPGATTQQQPSTDQQQPQQQTPPGFAGGDLASASGMSSGLASGYTDITAPGDSGPSGTAPGMIGPAITYSATRLIQVQFLGDGSIFPTTFAGAPVANRSMFRIADNESPQPQDRIFLTYNWAHNVNKDAFTKVPENVFIRDFNLINNLDVHYETFGFEKTFWCNYASIGVRVPFFQVAQDEPKTFEGALFQVQRGLDENTIGDASIVLKTVLAYDCQSNNLLSGGVVVTLPTAPDVKVYNALQPAVGQVGRSISTTIVQPWVGTFIDLGHVYVHGFSSVAFPLRDDDVNVWFADIGVGWLCTCWFVPTVELHYQTPINESSNMYREPVGVVDSLIVTAGAHIAFYEASTVTVGLATPLTGPGPFDVEVIAQLNIRF